MPVSAIYGINQLHSRAFIPHVHNHHDMNLFISVHSSNRNLLVTHLCKDHRHLIHALAQRKAGIGMVYQQLIQKRIKKKKGACIQPLKSHMELEPYNRSPAAAHNTDLHCFGKKLFLVDRKKRKEKKRITLKLQGSIMLDQGWLGH